MSSPLRIVPAKRTAAVAAQLADFGRQTFQDTYAAQNSAADMAQYLAEHFGPEQQLAELQDPNTVFFLALMQQQLVGYAKLFIGSALGAEPGADVRNRAELQRLYVQEDWQGTGLGASLLRRSLDEARQRGCRSLVLSVWEKNEKAQEFYRRKGFKQIGETEYRVGQDVQNDYIPAQGAVMNGRLHVRLGWVAGLILGWLSACTPAADRQPRAAPIGRYEGTLTHRGAELPVVLNVYQDSASRLVQVQLHTADAPLYSRWFDSVAYQAPSLAGRLPGGSRLALREEPNFLTGAVWLHDTLRAELVAVRRGAADLPAYSVTRQPAAGAAPGVLRYLPLDTARRRPALLYWPAPGATGAAYGWADWLARQGVQVAVANPAAVPDSVAARQVVAALRRLQAEAQVDSAKLGVWATGAGGRAAALAALMLRSQPRFALVQGTALSRADRGWLRQLGKQPVAVLGLYGALDTTLNAAESSQLLRAALRRRGSGVKVYGGATAALVLPRPEKPDSVRRWPAPPADLAPSLKDWLETVLRR